MARRYCLLYLLLLAAPLAGTADDAPAVRSLEDGAVSPPAKIEQLSWLVGRWVGEGLGGTAEDVIAPAAGGQMMGMFRQSKPDGSVNFYEFYLFAEQAGSLTVRLKHFSPMLASWEEREAFVEFPLVAIEERAAYFDGLSYVLGEKGDLTVGVHLGEGHNVFFHYHKVE